MNSTQTNPLPAVQANPIATKSAQGLGWLNWAVFLGMSWTWCIGMFLPYLLVREYGVAGWIVFAIPNVLGAAAMGWVIRSAAESESIATSHRIAAQLFSAVTIAFHLYFILAVVESLAVSMVRPPLAMNLTLGFLLGGSALMYVYMLHQRDGDRLLAWITFIASTVVLTLLTFEMLDIAATSKGNLPGIVLQKNLSSLAMLAPVCVFGFLACPYLDLTFHRARQHTLKPRRSFGVGFGGFFLLMIVFTLIYSRPMLWSTGHTPLIAIFLFIHMTMQSAFTIAAHARELHVSRGVWTTPVIVLLAVGSWAAIWLIHDGKVIGKLPIDEIVYRIFMGFYGLVFPAYVWLIMLPARGDRQTLTAWNLSIYSIIVLAALPMFWMGFIADRMIWLPPGLAMVLLARLAIRFQPNSAPT